MVVCVSGVLLGFLVLFVLLALFPEVCPCFPCCGAESPFRLILGIWAYLLPLWRR